MRELCTFFVGQAGIQMASAIWESLCLEHGVARDGTIKYEPSIQENRELGTIFEELTPCDRYVPRAVFADLEPSVIDEVREGPYSRLFDPDTLLAGMEDAAGNFARGYYTLGGKLVGALTNSVRRLIERCDNFESLMAFSSLGGGTGSGLLAIFIERACIEFAGRHLMQFSVVPSSRMAAGPVEVYNCVHHLYHSSDSSDLNIFLDNSSLFNICTRQLHVRRPTFITVNRVIGPLVAGITASVRFRCSPNGSISELLTNLIPFPTIHYPMITFVPFCTNIEAERSLYTTSALTNMVFRPDYRTVTATLDEGLSIATCLTYRGQHSVYEITRTLECMRNCTNNLVDWCPTAFKVTYTPQPPCLLPGMGPDKITRSLVMITNNTSIAEVFDKAEAEFLSLFNKRAFLHWCVSIFTYLNSSPPYCKELYVGEGMEMGEFTEALEKVRSIAADIRTLENESLKLARSYKKDDKEGDEQEFEIDEGEEKRSEIDKRKAAARGKKQTAYAPGRLINRCTRYSGSDQIPLCHLMNYRQCPEEEPDTFRSRPRRNKDRTSLKEQVEASQKRFKNVKSQCGYGTDQTVYVSALSWSIMKPRALQTESETKFKACVRWLIGPIQLERSRNVPLEYHVFGAQEVKLSRSP
ncbi:hypothetical protein Aperf_G00000094122 [Anoplocephala perfoliata]